MSFKKILSAICIVTVMIMSCGCSMAPEYPELSEEQMELVADYSAALLMKYDSSSPSRLLPQGYDDGSAMISVINVPTVEPIPEETAEANVSFENTEPEVVSENLDVIDNTTGEVNHADGFADHLAGTGINIEYDYTEVLDSYPADGNNMYFATDASEGNKLLVMHFLISTSGETRNINMKDLGLKYRVSIDGGLKKKIMTTMLDNDILTFSGELVSDQKVDLVAIAEVSESEATGFSSLVFTIKGEEFSTTMQLQ